MSTRYAHPTNYSTIVPLLHPLAPDLIPSQAAVNKLIEKRFDKINAEANGADHAHEPNGTNGASGAHASPLTSAAPSPAKRAADDSDFSDPVASPKPKKKRTKPTSAEEDDAAFAARLQAEENGRIRSTRGGATRKKTPLNKKKKKKSAAKVKEDGEGASGSEAEPQRKGGFHVSNSSSPVSCVPCSN